MDEVGLMQVLSGLFDTSDSSSPDPQCQRPNQATIQLLGQSLSIQGVPRAAPLGYAGEPLLAPPLDG